MRRYIMMTAAAAAVATLAALSPAAASTASKAPRAGSAAPAHAQKAASGTRLWVSRYNGPAKGVDQAFSVAASRTRVFVTGYSVGRKTGYDYATVAYSAATGRQLWVSRYNGPANGMDYANSVAVSPNGTRVFVTGGSSGRNNRSGYVTVAYSAATGRTLWVRRHTSTRSSVNAFSLAVYAAGTRVFVTGDCGTVAYSAATGRQLWVSSDSQFGVRVTVSQDGRRVFVTGPSGTAAYSAATGRRLWVSTGGPSNSVAVNPRGTAVFVTGTSWDTDSNAEYATAAYSASTGRQLWASHYIGRGDNYDQAFSVALNPRGTAVFVTGYSGQIGATEVYATVAYDAATGSQLWVRRYGRPGWNEGYSPSSLALSPNGTRVYITGDSGGYATVAYSAATGRLLWARHYNPPGKGGVPSSIAVSPRGTTVFVTGTSPSRSPVSDYATVAYRG